MNTRWNGLGFHRFGRAPSTRDAKCYSFLQIFLFSSVALLLILPSTFTQASTSAPAQAQADDQNNDVMARLDVIQTLSDRNNDEGLRQLLAFQKSLPHDTDPKLRMEVVYVLSGLYLDAGKSKLSEQTFTQFKQLAQETKDKEAMVFMQILDAYSIFDKSGFEASLNHLDKLQATVEKGATRLQYRYAATLAGFYLNQGAFDKALKQYLEMLNLAEKLPRRQLQARMRTWGLIAGLYLSMKDPEKALVATTEALAVSSAKIAPKAFVDISISRGEAFSTLGRNNEALREYETALRIGKEENLPFVVTRALVNIADQHLIKREFKQAEIFAKEALSHSEPLEDHASTEIARFNYGIALIGQGKIKQGAELANKAIEFYKKHDAKLDVEEMVGELSSAYEDAGFYKESIQLVREQQKLAHELFQSDRAKTVLRLQEQFDTEQRKRHIEILEKNSALKDADIKNHRLQKIVAFLGSLSTLFAGAFVYMLYRRGKKLNQRLQEANTQLEFHAIRDPLTGLHNRRSFISLMSTRVSRVEIERREGCHGNPDCMVLMDIDHFKHINDTWGHAVGDIVLKEVANRLRNVVRDCDMLMRWGGEEFLIFSPKSNPEQITSLVDRVLHTIGDTPFICGELAVPVTITAGFISVPFSEVSEEVCDWERSLQIADMALYLGKTHGRNRAYGLARLLVPHEEAIPTLTHDLAAAIERNMVEVIEVLGPEQAAL